MCYYCLLCGNRGIGIEWVELGRECHLEFLHNSSLLSCPSPWFRVDSVCHHNDSKPKIFHANSFWGGRKCPPSPCSLRKGMLYLDCWKLVYYIHIARVWWPINKLLSRRIFRFGFDQKCSPFSSQYIWLGMSFLLGQPENTTVGELLLLLEERWEGPRQSWAMLPSNPNCFHNFKEAASNASIVFHFLSSPLACFHQIMCLLQVGGLSKTKRTNTKKRISVSHSCDVLAICL